MMSPPARGRGLKHFSTKGHSGSNGIRVVRGGHVDIGGNYFNCRGYGKGVSIENDPINAYIIVRETNYSEVCR